MYKTCKIDQGTVTLKEIAKHFDLEPDELRWFHNRFCPLEDLIGTDIHHLPSRPWRRFWIL